LHAGGINASEGEALLFVLARVRRLRLCLPGVFLNPVRDDLRMMAPKPVAARDGAMKEK